MFPMPGDKVLVDRDRALDVHVVLQATLGSFENECTRTLHFIDFQAPPPLPPLPRPTENVPGNFLFCN